MLNANGSITVITMETKYKICVTVMSVYFLQKINYCDKDGIIFEDVPHTNSGPFT
jgi:hypothetical protein